MTIDDKFGLREGLEVAASGELTLDKEKAREKLRMFRLPDPHFYVLQFVRAASLLGAPSIHFEFNVGESHCWFEAVLPPEAFDDFWEAGFRSRRTQVDVAVYNIAQGIGAAQALNPALVTVTSGARRITFVELLENVQTVSPTTRTTIVVREKFRFGHVFEYFKVDAEHTALQNYCQFSAVQVFVNGKPLPRPDLNAGAGHALRPDVSRLDDRPSAIPLEGYDGAVALVPDTTSLDFHLLRDDVQVHQMKFPVERMGAVGWLNSRTLQTDLTGLRLASPGVETEVLPAFLGAYHGALHRWASRSRLERDQTEYIGQIALRQMGEIRALDVEVPSSSRALFEWWLDNSSFPDNNAESYPLRHFIQDGTVNFTRRRIPIHIPAAFGPVAILRGDLADLGHLLEPLGIALVDIQQQLQALAIRQRNEEMFHRQQPETFALPPLHVRVELDGSVGYLAVPEQDHVDHEHGALLFKDQRLMRRTAMTNPLMLIVEGAFEVDFAALDFVRDDAFRAFAHRLVAAIPALLDVAGKAYQDAPSRYLREVLGVLIANAFNEFHIECDVLMAFGMSEQELREIVGGQARPEGRVDALGAAADAEIYYRLPNGYVSLRQVLSWEQPPIVMTSNLDTSNFDTERDRVLRVLPRDAELFTELRSTELATDVAVRTQMRTQFLAKPRFDDTPVEGVWTEEFAPEGASWSAKISLLGVGAALDLQLIALDRLVTTHTLPCEVGQLRVAVRNDWKLNNRFNDVIPDERYHTIVARIQAHAADIALRFIAHACEQLHIGHAALEYLWWRARSGSDQELIPAFEFIETPGGAPEGTGATTTGQWRAIGLTTAEVRRRVHAGGQLLHVTRADPFDGYTNTDVTVIRVPFSAVDYTKMFPHARLVLVDGEHGESLKRFEQKAPFTRPRKAMSLSWRLTADRFQQDGMLDLVGTASTHTIHIVWRDRELETITMESDLGTFSTVVTGPEVKPDPTYSYLVDGRREVLEAAQAGAERLVTSYCKRLQQAPPHGSNQWPAIQRWLLGVFARRATLTSHKIRTLIVDTPLFTAPGEQYRSFNQLLQRAVHGVVSWSDQHGDPRAMLYIENRAMRARIEAAFDGELTLAPIDEFMEKFDQVALSQYHADVLLNGVATTLVQARGTRRELFDDTLAVGLRWSDEVTDVCRVDARGVTLGVAHPLVARTRADGPNSIAAAFLASVVYTEINARYRGIVDEHELELQARLLSSAVQRLPRSDASLTS